MLGTRQNLCVFAVIIIAFLFMSGTFSSAAETITNTYDELNRLTKSVFGGRFSIEYSYDSFGNRSQKKISLLDISAPDTFIVSKPNSLSKAVVTFTYTSEAGAAFECQLDGAAWSECNSGTISYAGLPEGSHTFRVKATDRIGNTDAAPAIYSWTVDITPPDTTISTQPMSLTNSTIANFTFTSTEPTGTTFECQLDSGTWIACNGGFVAYSDLASTQHTFTVRAIDAAGNADATPATYTWTVDLTAPSSIITAPYEGSGIINAAFTITGTATDAGSTVSTVELSINNGPWIQTNGNTSWSFVWTIPSDGAYTIRTRATDSAGNVETPGNGITLTAYNRQPSSVAVSGRQLLLNNAPFTVKGVNYIPVPIGDDPESVLTFGDYFTLDYSTVYERDLPLLRTMGANTISLRTWDNTSDHHDFLDSAYNGGTAPIYVIACFSIKAGRDIDTASPDNEREAIRAEFREMVETHKNHPAILMWAIGSELNSETMYGADAANLFSLINELATEAHATDPDHPVMMPLADENLIATVAAYDAGVAAIDIWGANIYRGNSFGSLFADYQALSGKPLLITGFGLDAYNDATMAEDETSQADYAGALWEELVDNSAIVVGGIYAEWSDQWWAGGLSVEADCPEADNLNAHGDCGAVAPFSPDGYDNYEWWGLMRLRDNGSAPDIMTERAAYNILKGYFTGVMSVSLGNLSHTYDGTHKSPTVSTFPANVAVDITYNGAATAPVNAGIYEVIATVNDPIYRGSAAGTLIIVQRTLTVTATAANRIYNGTDTATVTLSDNRVSGDALTATYVSASFADKNVGSVKTVSVSGISISGADSGNYSLADTSTTTSANISALPVLPRITVGNKTYDRTTAATILTRSLSVVLAVDAGNVYLSGGTATFIDANAGTNKRVTVTGLRLSGTEAGNYNLRLSIPTTTAYANITKASLTITVFPRAKVYGTAADPSLVYTTAGLVTGDTMSGSLIRVAGENVGAYAISQGTVNVSSPANYTLTYTGANLSITPRPITVRAVARSKKLGAADPALIYQITSGSLINGDVFSGGLSRTAGETVGIYAINQGTLSAGSNYNFTYIGANFEVRLYYTITKTVNGSVLSIYPSMRCHLSETTCVGEIPVNQSVRLTIKPLAPAQILSVTLNGLELGPVNSITLSDLQSPPVIGVTFSP